LDDPKLYLKGGSRDGDEFVVTQGQIPDGHRVLAFEALKFERPINPDRQSMHAKHVRHFDHWAESLEFFHAARTFNDHAAFLHRQAFQDHFNSASVLSPNG